MEPKLQIKTSNPFAFTRLRSCAYEIVMGAGQGFSMALWKFGACRRIHLQKFDFPSQLELKRPLEVLESGRPPCASATTATPKSRLLVPIGQKAEAAE